MYGIEQLAYSLYIVAIVASAALIYLKTRTQTRVPKSIHLGHIVLLLWSAVMATSLLTEQTIQNGVFEGRYLDWAVTTPLLLLTFGLSIMRTYRNKFALGGLLFAQIVMVLSGYFAETAHSEAAKYSWFAIGLAALLVVFYYLWFVFRDIENENWDSNPRLHTSLATFLSVFWLTYPVIWFVGTPGIELLDQTWTSVAFLSASLLAKAGFAFVSTYLLQRHVLHQSTSLEDINVKKVLSEIKKQEQMLEEDLIELLAVEEELQEVYLQKLIQEGHLDTDKDESGTVVYVIRTE